MERHLRDRVVRYSAAAQRQWLRNYGILSPVESKGRVGCRDSARISLDIVAACASLLTGRAKLLNVDVQANQPVLFLRSRGLKFGGKKCRSGEHSFAWIHRDRAKIMPLV